MQYPGRRVGSGSTTGGDHKPGPRAISFDTDPGSTSVVSSADIYEFDGDGLISMITSYAVELPG